MGLPGLPPLWQSARWQLAWHDGGRRIHPLGGSVRRFEACLVANDILVP
jgi:hypothetical protein